MRKLWKGLVLGALVGGAVKAVREVQGEGTVDDLALSVGRTAGEAALAGAAIGFVLDRRSRRSRRKRSKLERAKAATRSKVSVGSMMAGAGALADAARPMLHTAAERAKPRLEAAADAARPHVEHATDLAKARATKAAEAAKPRIDAAAGAARAKLAELDLPVVVAV
jgi:hypothetical protein